MKTHPSLLVLQFCCSQWRLGANRRFFQRQLSEFCSDWFQFRNVGQHGFASRQSNSAGSDTEQMMEGCIIREQQDYYP